MCVSTYFPTFWAFPQDPTFDALGRKRFRKDTKSLGKSDSGTSEGVSETKKYLSENQNENNRRWDITRSNGEIDPTNSGILFNRLKSPCCFGCFDSTEERPWKKGLLGVERTFSY
jgi:transglutaminase-like putative cysteine protease